MKDLKKDYPVASLCTALDVSSSGYYVDEQRLENPSERAKEDAILKERIREIHKEHWESYGSPRILDELKKEGYNPAKKRVARLMQEESIVGVQKKAFKPATTDTTCIAVTEGWLYLAVVLDLFNREIVGWATSNHNDTDLVLKAMDKAIAGHGRPQVHHSDRGSTLHL